MAVLGLISQGRSTVAALGSRLGREFSYANFAPNSAHKSLPRLAARGYVRCVREGQESSEDVYEIAPTGLRHFEAWLHDAAIIPHPLRDPVQGKLAFVDHGDLPELIATVRAYEDAAADEYAAAHGKVRSLLIRMPAGRTRAALDRIRLEYTATLWGQQAKRLAVLREKLEELRRSLDAET